MGIVGRSECRASYCGTPEIKLTRFNRRSRLHLDVDNQVTTNGVISFDSGDDPNESYLWRMWNVTFTNLRMNRMQILRRCHECCSLCLNFPAARG